MSALLGLVGIPWRCQGRDAEGIDCVGLALLAQRELWGRDYQFPYRYDPERDADQEESLLRWLVGIARLVTAPAPGRLVVMQMEFGGRPYIHIGTLLEEAPMRMLHIYPGHRSQAVRFSGRYLPRVRGYFDGGEGAGCRSQL